MKFLGLFWVVSIAYFGFGQDGDTLIQKPVDSVAIVTKRAIQIPEFKQFKLDTIRLEPNDRIINDSYTAVGRAYVYDALHSFQRRRMDHFGGYLNDKINAGLAQIRQDGFPSDLKKLYIQINPKTLTVVWAAVVGPSVDGKCYLHVDSRGSAGGGIAAVQKQCPRMHNLHTGMHPVKVLEFSDDVIQCYDWYGSNQLDSAYNTINIRQHFYKYYDPRIGTSVSLEDFVKQENTKDSTQLSATSTAMVVPHKTYSTYKSYKVRSGDTLSQIAQKYHTSITAIKRTNGLRSDMIREGQYLKIPN